MSDAHSLPLTQLKTQQDQPARNYEENKMTIQPNPDNVGPEAYARRIEAGDQILYIKEAAAFVRKSVDTMRHFRHLGTGPHSFRHGRNVAYWKTDLILWLAEESSQPCGRSDGSHAHARPQVYRSRETKRRNGEAG
jgi:hypothetical protein